jgi:prepilin-type N-terminal cleavage/methylation domain-containing protein
LRRGFTLIEASLTTAIVGVAFVATMGLFAACTQQNRVGTNMTAAMLLASHVQETMAGLSFNDPGYGASYYGPESGETLATFDDVDDFDGQVFNPPIDALRRPLPELGSFTQQVSVVPVYAMQPGSNTTGTTIPKTTYTGAARVTVKVLYKPPSSAAAQEIYRTSWIRVDYHPPQEVPITE